MTTTGKRLFGSFAAAVGAATICLAPLAAQSRGATSNAGQAESARAWFAEQLRFADGEEPVDAEDLDLLARLWGDATDSAREENVRRETLRRLLDEMIRVLDTPVWRYSGPALDAMAARVDEVEGLRVPPPPVPRSAHGSAQGKVEVGGRGDVPLVLVGDLDYDGSLYRDFMAANGDRFTMYAVTLPGTGGTAPPARPERGPYSATPWLDHAESLLLDLVDRRGLDRPVLVGVGSSVPLVARLAINHPDRFRALVLLNGLVFQPRPSPLNPTRLITTEELTRWFDATLPDVFPPTAAEQVRRSYLSSAALAAQDSGRARELALAAAETHPDVFTHYSNEVGTVDLRPLMSELRIPALAIPSVHDGSSPSLGSELRAGQWYGLELDHPEIPLSVVPFRNTRNYAPVDRPEELGEAIADFLDGRQVEGEFREPALVGYSLSPRASTTQVVGATEVTVDYYSPAVNERELWGGLVPYDAVWRAGANAATSVSFSRDVSVAGEPLPAGRYTLFIEPREDEPWTVIFNRVPVNFGSSFFHRPEHDALRIDVEPEEGVPHQEHLRYRILPMQPVGGRFEMRWGTTALALDLEAPNGTGMERIPAGAPDSLRALSWTELATDSLGDAARTQAPDAGAVSYSADAFSGTLWFRVDLEDPPNPLGVGVNVAVDTDLDQSTGSAWWAGSADFTFDRVVTVWVTRLRDEFWGTVGISDHAAALAGDYSSLGSGNLSFAVDVPERALFVGVPASELDDDGLMRLLVAVGTNTVWNDNVPDRRGVLLDLRE